MQWKEVIRFWFKGREFKDWFSKNKKFDATVRRRFLKVREEAARGEKEEWRKTPRGRLAEIIVLDQFSRNIFRGKAEAFRYDGLALALSQEAVRAGADKKLSKTERQFLYMPHMHSESRTVHKTALKLFRSLGKEWIGYEMNHKKIIDRFGRFPHRNAPLGRTSTREEKKFLKTHKGF